MVLPVQFPRDPYCRAISRLLLTQDEKTGELYLGVTPDGVTFGRDMLSKITAWYGNQELRYTCFVDNNTVILKTNKGSAAFAIGMPNKLLVEGNGISLQLGNGKSAGLFMGGGSAVDDAAEGALYVTCGVRLRIISRRGAVEVRSAWDLDSLSDPNPEVYIHPDGTGRLEAVVFETDFDEHVDDDGETVTAAARQTEEEFNRFLGGLVSRPETQEGIHAAYIIWTTLQPDRVLNQQRITEPEYFVNRRHDGTALLYDNTLMAAFMKDAFLAADRLCSFLKYIQPCGIVPKTANNRSFLLESEAPLFGVVLAARPDICKVINRMQYESMHRALEWWISERFCPRRKLFYYLHRYEPACEKGLPFSDDPPEFAPELNIYMVLWLKALALIAEQSGDSCGKNRCVALAEDVEKALHTKLWNGDRYICINIDDQPACLNHPCGDMAVLMDERVSLNTNELPVEYALPLLLAADESVRAAVKKDIKTDAIGSLRQAMLVLAANM